MKRSTQLIWLALLAVAVITVGLVSLSTINHRSPLVTNPHLISVAASFYPYGEFAQAVGGALVDVHVITPAGVEPHDFEPTPQDVVRIQTAKLLVYNGAGVDTWADRLRADLPNTRIVQGVASATLRTDPKDPQTSDPHIWLDPVIAASIVDQIATALAGLDPSHQTDYQAGAASYRSQLSALDADYQTGLVVCTQRAFVTSHAAFGYLADRYRLEQIPVAGLLEQEPSPAQLAAIADLVKARGIKYIFTETLTSPRLSETIAGEVGARTLILNPLEGLTMAQQQAGASYLSIMHDNLTQLRLALSCQ